MTSQVPQEPIAAQVDRDKSREANNSSDLPGRLNAAEAERDEALTFVLNARRDQEAAQAEVLALRAEVEEARKVIEPFASIAESVTSLPDDHIVTCDASWAIPFGSDGVMWEQEIGHFRAAAAFLSNHTEVKS